MVAILNHPTCTHKSRGDPQWNVYKVQSMLDDEIKAGKHLRMNPKELHKIRDEYKLFKPTSFRGHIDQLIRTTKLFHTLKVKSYSKSKKNCQI